MPHYSVKLYLNLSVLFVFFNSVIDVSFSISRVGIHGHAFACCLTTGRGPGVRRGMSA